MGFRGSRFDLAMVLFDAFVLLFLWQAVLSPIHQMPLQWDFIGIQRLVLDISQVLDASNISVRNVIVFAVVRNVIVFAATYYLFIVGCNRY